MFKVTITQFETKPDERGYVSEFNKRDVYEQTVDALDVLAVINAVNSLPPPMLVPKGTVVFRPGVPTDPE